MRTSLLSLFFFTKRGKQWRNGPRKKDKRDTTKRVNEHFSSLGKGIERQWGEEERARTSNSARQCKDDIGASRSQDDPEGWIETILFIPVLSPPLFPPNPLPPPLSPPPNYCLTTTEAICRSWIFITADFSSFFAILISFLTPNPILLHILSATPSSLPSPTWTISESRPQRLLRGRLERVNRHLRPGSSNFELSHSLTYLYLL